MVIICFVFFFVFCYSQIFFRYLYRAIVRLKFKLYNLQLYQYMALNQ